MYVTPSLLTILAGCSQGPETSINPSPAAVPATIAQPELGATTYVDENGITHRELASPSPRVTNNGVAIYELEPLMIAAGCMDSNAVITFAGDRRTVSFSCIPHDDPLTFWRADLPLPQEITTFAFEYTSPLYCDLIDNNISTMGWAGGMTVWPLWIDVGELPITKTCAGHDLSLIFWATFEGASTLCGDDAQPDRGHDTIEFPTGALTIIFRR